MCNENHNHKRGVSLDDKEAHSADHKNWSRRSFLQTLGLTAGTGLAFGGYSLSAMNSAALLPALMSGGVDDRILVLIRLKGGNDGLNTIIPLYDYSTYIIGRPSIGIGQNNIINLNNAHGIPNSMQNIMPLWNDGAMKVINGVGYDNHNLSHFSSTDIWNSANQDIETSMDSSGWLGRFILDNNPDYLENLPNIPGAIKISSGSNITFHNPDRIDLAVNFNTPERLLNIAETGFLYDTENLPDDCYYGEQVGFLRSIMNVTANYAPQISDAYTTGENSVSYSNNELSRQLAIVARLIKGQLGTKLYMVTLDGFDTHENQNNKHPQLMRNLTDAVSEFYQDLQVNQMDDQVLSMTISEFGRRIAENDGGTDHGTAAPLMMFGPALNGNGVLGDNPDLQDVDNNGNLKHSTDFRSIYATVLESWLCLDPMQVDRILGGSYNRLDNIGLNCITVSTDDIPITQYITHKARMESNNSTIIEYTNSRPGPVEITVYSIMGQKISTIENSYQPSGTHEARFVHTLTGQSLMPLIYRIQSGGQVYSGKFVAAN